MAKPQQRSPEQDSELEALRAQLEAERTARASLENNYQETHRRLIEAERAQMSESERRVAAEQDSCESLISSLNGQADSLEAQIAQLADEPGHGAEVAKLTRELSRVQANITREEVRKSDLAAERERVKAQGEKTKLPPQPAGRVLANGAPIDGMSGATKAWLDRHPKVFTDAAYCRKAIAYAGLAVDAEGIRADSPEFFEFIEEKLGERQPETPEPGEGDTEEEGVASADQPYSRPGPASSADGEDLDYQTKRPQGRAAGPGSIAAAIPPTRTIPGNKAPKGARTPALTAEEREVADNLYPSIHNPADRYAKYATDKAKMANMQRQYFSAMN